MYLEKMFTGTKLDIPASDWNEPIDMLLKTNLYFLEVLWDKDYPLEGWRKQKVETSQAEAGLICSIQGKEIKVNYTDFLPDDEKYFFKNMNYVFSLILKHTNLFHELVYGNSLNEVIYPIIPFIDPVMGKSIASFGKTYSKRDIQFIPYSEVKNWQEKIYTKSRDETSSFCDRRAIFSPVL